MELSFGQIFTDTNNDGFHESLREFFGYFVKQFIPLVQTQIEKLYFARLDYPLLVFPLYLAAIIGLIAFWKKPSYKTAILAAIPAGLLFYSYFHYWVYWCIVIGLITLYAIIFERRNKTLIRSLAILLGILAIISIPYFVNYFSFKNTPGAYDLALRFGIASGRSLALATMGWTYISYAILAIAIYFVYFRKGHKNIAVLFWIFLVAMVTIWNVQIIIGFSPTPNNWRRTVSPILFIIIIHLIYTLSRRAELRWPRLKPIIIGVLILATSGVALKKIVNAVQIVRQPEQRILTGQTLPNELLASWQWLNGQTIREPRVATNSFMTSLYLTAYTDARPTLPHAVLSLQSTQELENHFLEMNKIFGVSPETLEQVLLKTYIPPCHPACTPNSEDNVRKPTWHLYAHFFRTGDVNAYINNPKDIDSAYIKKLRGRYEAMRVNPESVLKDVKYIYYGPWEQELGAKLTTELKKRFELVYKNSLVEIYRRKKT